MGLRSIFRAILLNDASHVVDEYALRNRRAVKPSPGQLGFMFGDDESVHSPSSNPKWDERAHPRAPKGANEGHGGEFVKRSDQLEKGEVKQHEHWAHIGNGVTSEELAKQVPGLAVDPLSIKGTHVLTFDQLFGPREINNRRIAARARRQKIERDKARLFADEIAAEQKDPREELEEMNKRAMDRGAVSDQRSRDKWMDNFRKLASKSPDEQAKLVAAWNASAGPKDHAYFAGWLNKAIETGLAKHVTDRGDIADPELRSQVERMDKTWRTLKDIDRSADPNSPYNIAPQRLAEELQKYNSLGIKPPAYESTKPTWAELQAEKQRKAAATQQEQEGQREAEKKQLLFPADELKPAIGLSGKPFQPKLLENSAEKPAPKPAETVNNDAAIQVSKLADVYEQQAKKGEGGSGLAVGAEFINDRWKADSMRGMLRDVQGGMSIDEAEAKWKGEARKWIAAHKARRPKDANWARWDGAADATLENAARILRQGQGDKPADKPSGIQMPTRSNENAKAGDQLGLFGGASRPKREAPPTLAPGGESKGKQASLFDTKGSADQSMLFATDDVTPDEMIGSKSAADKPKGFEPKLIDQPKPSQKIDAQTGNRNTAQRMVNADNDFKANLKELGGLSDEQAEKAFDYYRENKLFKSDAVMGRHTVKHGALMERDVIRKAAGIGQDAKPAATKKPKQSPRDAAIRAAIEANGGHEKSSVDDVDKIRDSLYYNGAARADGAPPKHADIRAVMDQMKTEAGQKFEKSAAGKRAADPRYSDPMAIARERESSASLTDHDSALVDLQTAHEALERAKKAKESDHTLKLETPGSDRHNRASAAHDKAIADAEKAKARAFNKFVPHADRIAERSKGFEPKLLEGAQKKSDEPAQVEASHPSIDELAKSAVAASGSIWKHAKEKTGRGLVEMTSAERKQYADAVMREQEAQREASKPPVSPARAAAQKKFMEMRDREAQEAAKPTEPEAKPTEQITETAEPQSTAKPKAAKPSGPEPQYKVRDDLPMRERLNQFYAGTLKPGDQIDIGRGDGHYLTITRVNAKSVTTDGGVTWKHHEYKPVGKFENSGDLRSQIEDFERSGGLEGAKLRAKGQKKLAAAIVKSSDNPLEKVLSPEGLKQVLEANSDSVGHMAEQLASALPGMDRAAVRQAILDHRKANGVNEAEREKGKISVAANSATPTIDELEHALKHVEQDGNVFRLVDPDTGEHVRYSSYENKNQAVNAFINKVRHRMTRQSEHDSEYQNRNFVKVRGNYKSWLKSHGANENSILGIDPKHIKAKQAESMANAQMTLADYKAHMNKVDAGQVSPEEHKAAFDKFMASRDGIKAELSKLKKDEIDGWHHQDGTRMFSSGRDGRKDQVVDLTLDRLMHEFNKTDTANRWSHGEDREATLRKSVEGMTAEHLSKHAEEHASEVKARQERQKANQDRFDNPKTAADWQAKRNHVGGYHKLTPEQQQAHDEAYAAHRREHRPFKPVKATTVEGFKGGSEKTGNLGIVEGHHQKRNAPTWTVTVEEHLGDSWKDALSKTKALGGNYVNARIAKAYGATPGFQFFNKESAEKFHAVLGGQAADVSDKVDEREAERRANQVDTLSERAAALKERAEASLGRDRKDNTAKRARQAASAEADARNDIAKAETLTKIANHIDDGKAVHLKHVRNKAQVDELDSQLRRAKWNHIGAIQKTPEGKNMKFNEREAMHNAEPSKESIAHAEYPYPYLHQSEMESMAGKLANVPGLKLFAGSLKRLAKEQRENNPEGKDYGQIADRNVLEKIKEAIPKMRRHPSPEVRAIASRFGEKFDAMKRLEGMDITNTAELRAALREYHSLKATPAGADPIKEAERKLKRMKIEGFFPTPKTLVERMLDHADIEDGHEVLEPSAGIGHIMDAIKERHPEAKLHGIEKDYEISELLGLKGHKHDRGDFLEHTKQYDRIVMNPPFENRQDEKHVRHAYSLLKPGGKLVAITGSGAHNNERSAGFRDWLSEVGAKTYENPAGSFDTDEAFKRAGVNTHMVIISKPTGETTEKYSIEFEPVLIDHYAGKDQMLFGFGEEDEPNSPAIATRRRPRSVDEAAEMGSQGHFRIVGTSKDVTRCDRCGRSDLARTIVVAIAGDEDGEVYHFGSDCVSKILNRSSHAIENEALLADHKTKIPSKDKSRYLKTSNTTFLTKFS